MNKKSRVKFDANAWNTLYHLFFCAVARAWRFAGVSMTRYKLARVTKQ
jgi:hypothetical protein